MERFFGFVPGSEGLETPDKLLRVAGGWVDSALRTRAPKGVSAGQISHGRQVEFMSPFCSLAVDFPLLLQLTQVPLVL